MSIISKLTTKQIIGIALLVGALSGQTKNVFTAGSETLIPIDTVKYLTGQYNPYIVGDFSEVPRYIAGRRKMVLRKEANTALISMVNAARVDGLILSLVSGARTFGRQQAIWTAKYKGSRIVNGENLKTKYPDQVERCRVIMKYTAAPGLSRHHWGTEVDLNSVKPGYWESGDGVVVLKWLNENAERFGYVIAYPPGRENGSADEPWHWSYKPLAQPIYRIFVSRIGPDAFGDFMGRQYVMQLRWLEDYVGGINKELK